MPKAILKHALLVLLIPVAALADRLDLDGTSYAVTEVICTRGDGFYMIQANGPEVMIEVTTLDGRTGIDVFYERDGVDPRAGATLEPVPYSGKDFDFSGEVAQSDGRSVPMVLTFTTC